MRMTTKLVSLLTILFVFSKFGEPTQVMMSIYGDKSFYFDSQAVTTDTIVGFVYDDANGAFAVVNCSGKTVTPFTLKTDCTVAPDAAFTPTTSTTATEVEASALKKVTAENFPTTNVDTNMMIAALTTTNPIATTTNEVVTQATAMLVTFAPVVGSSGTATDSDSTFLCNHLSATTSDGLFAVLSTFGQLKAGTTQIANYLPVMKCAGVVRDGTPTEIAVATFILIVTNHADITSRLSTLTFPSVVLLPQSINQTTAATTVVGYINGIDKCPTGNNVTFEKPTATSCKGTISINTNGNYSFSYNGTKYYLPMTDANNEVTCPVPSTTTCEDSFALILKYSNALIGMLLIFMLKMLQSY